MSEIIRDNQVIFLIICMVFWVLILFSIKAGYYWNHYRALSEELESDLIASSDEYRELKKENAVLLNYKEELRGAFWHGVNTTIPECVIKQGPIACVDYIDQQFKFWLGEDDGQEN